MCNIMPIVSRITWNRKYPLNSGYFISQLFLVSFNFSLCLAFSTHFSGLFLCKFILMPDNTFDPCYARCSIVDGFIFLKGREGSFCSIQTCPVQPMPHSLTRRTKTRTLHLCFEMYPV